MASVPRATLANRDDEMSAWILIAYVIGVALGLLAARSEPFGRVWPHIVRAQILVSAIALSIIAVWRIDNIDSIVWPLLMTAAIAVSHLVTYVTYRGPDRSAHAVLQTWASNANSGFWVIPVGAALGGAPGALAGVLMDRAATPLYAFWIHVLRRDAPRRQRRRTSLIDQAPVIALGIGLILHLVGSAPQWTATLTLWVAPVLAASGAALFVGSVLHPSQRIDPRLGLRRWLALVALRVTLFGLIAVFAPTTSIKVVAILCALSIPAFQAPQVSTLYGYVEPVVAAGSRYGWIAGAAGLVVAGVVAH